MDRLKVTKYSSSSTACYILSEDLPLPLSTCKLLKCVDIESCTLVKHLESPAAWLHMIDCSLAALSQRLKMSWLRAREGGAVGRFRLATLLKVLLSFASSGDQEHTVDLSHSFLSTCMSYHLNYLGVLTNWSRSSPAGSVLLEG